MRDKYLSFDELFKHEIEGKDFYITCKGTGSNVVILALHGGGIEPGTEEIASALWHSDEGLFIFSGIKHTGNKHLHITSTKYNHPLALDLIKNAKLVLSIHGTNEAKQITYIGGRDKKGGLAIARSLRHSNFEVSSTPPSRLDGQNRVNIVNLGKTRRGIQIEISKTQRVAFFHSIYSREGRKMETEFFSRYIKALRIGICDLKQQIES